MTVQRRVAVRRNATANPPQIAVQPLAGVRRRDGRPEAQEPAETQLVFVFPAPKQRAPALPSLPPKRPRAREAAREYDALEALCVCSAGCGEWFADDAACRQHRDFQTARCLPPERAGLTRQTRPCDCWGRPEENGDIDA